MALRHRLQTRDDGSSSENPDGAPLVSIPVWPFLRSGDSILAFRDDELVNYYRSGKIPRKYKSRSFSIPARDVF